jgi:hypothetical protein
MNNEPVAIRYDFDGYGYQYIDSGSGSDWQTRVQGEPLYTKPQIKGCAECGVNGGHALYCVECAEKFVGEAATKLQQKQETIEGLNRDYDLLFAEHQLLLKKERVELTDEEIMKIANEVFKDYKNWHHYQLDFARALFKAQGEKNE